jgi:hypothetical protein
MCRIQAFDEQRLCVWLDDLGRVDLHSFNEQPWSTRLPLYEATCARRPSFMG